MSLVWRTGPGAWRIQDLDTRRVRPSPRHIPCLVRPAIATGHRTRLRPPGIHSDLVHRPARYQPPAAAHRPGDRPRLRRHTRTRGTLHDRLADTQGPTGPEKPIPSTRQRLADPAPAAVELAKHQASSASSMEDGCPILTNMEQPGQRYTGQVMISLAAPGTRVGVTGRG